MQNHWPADDRKYFRLENFYEEVGKPWQERAMPMQHHADERAIEVYKLWKDGSPGDEYFLIENRQRIGFDQYLNGTGLCIWHIDEAKATADNTDNTHPLYLVDAGGAYYTINTSTAQGTYQGDIFPSGGSGDDAHHGVFHPYAAKIYFGLTTHWDGPIELVRANLLPPGTVISRVTTCCDCVHTLAFIEENSCILDLDLDYDYGDNELDIEFTLRERAPAMLSVWLHLFYQDYFLGAVGLPPIDPRTTVDISLPLPNCGNVGVLATLATENAGIACSAWETVDTGN